MLMPSETAGHRLHRAGDGQRTLRAGSEVASYLAGALGGTRTPTSQIRRFQCAGVTNQFTDLMKKALSLFEKGPLALVAGGGFEPPTSGL
jgi:hypothetical protein